MNFPDTPLEEWDLVKIEEIKHKWFSSNKDATKIWVNSSKTEYYDLYGICIWDTPPDDSLIHYQATMNFEEKLNKMVYCRLIHNKIIPGQEIHQFIKHFRFKNFT